jgi:hypothetical protein
MKKLTFAPIAALALAACADIPTAPEMPLQAEGIALSSAPGQAGQGVAYHAYAAPLLLADVDGRNVTLCASWTDEDFDRSSTDFYSFDFLLQNGETEDLEKLGSARGDASGNDACFLVEDLEDGTYLFAANGMARVGSGQSTSTHHTLNAFEEVTIGGRYSILLTGGNAADGSYNMTGAPHFVLEYELRYNEDTVVDCGTSVDVAPTPLHHDCDAGNLTRTLHISSDELDGNNQVTVVFSLNGEVLLSHLVEGTNPGGGPPARPTSRGGR